MSQRMCNRRRKVNQGAYFYFFWPRPDLARSTETWGTSERPPRLTEWKQECNGPSVCRDEWWVSPAWTQRIGTALENYCKTKGTKQAHHAVCQHILQTYCETSIQTKLVSFHVFSQKYASIADKGSVFNPCTLHPLEMGCVLFKISLSSC